MEQKASILVIDDDDKTLSLLEKLLKGNGYSVELARSGEEGLDMLSKSEDVDIIFLDQRMSGMNGLEVCKKIKTNRYDVRVIMMTAYAAIADAVMAMKQGAYDYLTKPFNNLEEVELAVDRALKALRLERENRILKEKVEEQKVLERIITVNSKMKGILENVKKVGALDSTVLIEGESGTGKELIARAIHHVSARANGPFIAINCGSLSEELLESTLFGFEKGAFTGAIKTTRGCFEEAEKGTLLLDEVGDMSPNLQASFLRVMQEREFHRIGNFKKIKADFRLIAATNKKLEEEVAKGRMREDFYYRLNVFPIHLPPLREKREDIPLLAAHFIKRINKRLGGKLVSFTNEAMSALINCEWRGNCRELEHMIEQIAVTKRYGVIKMSDLPKYIFNDSQSSSFKELQKLNLFADEKKEFEKKYLEKGLAESKGNIMKMADLTGIKRQNLYPKLKKYKLI